LRLLSNMSPPFSFTSIRKIRMLRNTPINSYKS
jgi:hypothetical protein